MCYTTRSAVRTSWRMPMPSVAPTRAHLAWTARTLRTSRRMGCSDGSVNWRLRSGRRAAIEQRQRSALRGEELRGPPSDPRRRTGYQHATLKKPTARRLRSDHVHISSGNKHAFALCISRGRQAFGHQAHRRHHGLLCDGSANRTPFASLFVRSDTACPSALSAGPCPCEPIGDCPRSYRL